MQKLKNLLDSFLAAWRTLPESSPQRWFVVVAIIFGFIFAVITPPWDAPDEYNHIARAWGIGHGHVLAHKDGSTTGGELPASFKKLGDAAREDDFSFGKLPSLGSIPLNAHEKTYKDYPNMAVYSPIVYAPQVFGLNLGELLHLPAYYTLVVARLCNLIVYALLFYWAIRLLPFGKWVAVIIGLLPMHILLAGSASADPVTIGLGALMIGVILRIRHAATALTRKQFIWLLLLVAAMSLTKLPFPLFIGLLLFLPIRTLGGTPKRRWQMLGIAAAVAAIVGGGWLLLARTSMVPYGPPGVDNGAQIAHILQQPAEFLKTFVHTYATPKSDSFVQNYVIGVGPVEAWLPIWASYIYTVFLCASFTGIRTKSKAAFSRAQKILAGALSVVIFVIISALLYISWTPVGAPIIEGMQARYFTPLFLLLIPISAMRAAAHKDGLLNEAWYRYVPLIFLLASIIAAFHYFYTIKIAIPF